MTSRPPLALLLMAAGLLPFVAGALLQALHRLGVTGLDAADPWFADYGLVIAAFMAGTLWGRGRPAEPAERSGALIASNGLALALWAGAALSRGLWRDIILAMLFTALLALEGVLATSLAYPPAYRRARLSVSLIVVASLLLHAAAIS